MGDLIRIESECDRQTVLWLREHLGEQALNRIVLHMDVRGRPYVSGACHALGLTPPSRKHVTPRARSFNRVVDETYLATIRGILGGGYATA